MSNAAWAVRFANLGHAYEPNSWVFRDYSAEFARGRVTAILGPNGCGKSTLLKLLLGMMKPAAGSLEIHGSVAHVHSCFVSVSTIPCWKWC